MTLNPIGLGNSTQHSPRAVSSSVPAVTITRMKQAFTKLSSVMTGLEGMHPYSVEVQEVLKCIQKSPVTHPKLKELIGEILIPNFSTTDKVKESLRYIDWLLLNKRCFEAFHEVQRARGLSPVDKDLTIALHKAMSCVLFLQGSCRPALEETEKALGLDPTDIEMKVALYEIRTRTFFALKEFAEVSVEAQKGIDLGSSDVDVNASLYELKSRAFYAQGHYLNALTEVQKGIDLSPGDRDVKAKLFEIKGWVLSKLNPSDPQMAEAAKVLSTLSSTRKRPREES